MPGSFRDLSGYVAGESASPFSHVLAEAQLRSYGKHRHFQYLLCKLSIQRRTCWNGSNMGQGAAHTAESSKRPGISVDLLIGKGHRVVATPSQEKLDEDSLTIGQQSLGHVWSHSKRKMPKRLALQ